MTKPRKPIRNKAQMYELWQKGLLGNKPHTWADWYSLRASGWYGGWYGLVGMRSKAVGGPCIYRQTIWSAHWIGSASRDGLHSFTFSETMPDEILLIQGEVMRSERGLELTYSCESGWTMREAMRHPARASGLTARSLLQTYLWPSSYDDLMELLDLYPDHVIEFGAHDKAVGIYPNRNMVVWEVRAY